MSTKAIANYLEKGYWNDAGQQPHHWALEKPYISYDVSSLDQHTQDLVEQAFDRWDEIIDMDFKSLKGITDITVEIGDGNVTEGYYPARDFSVASSHPHLMESATITLNSDLISSGDTDTSQAYTTLLHEIGHAIGLGHAGPYNSAGSPSGGRKFGDDSDQKTVMSYFTQAQNPNTNADQASPITPQIADIVAAKSIYGLDSDTRDGPTTYGYHGVEVFDPDEWHGNNASFTIYDAGGTDTIKMSEASSDQVIDLRPGYFSSVGDASDVRANDTLEKNMTIAHGVEIENAVGGDGDDTLYGNELGNRLSGGKGSDNLYGYGGDDVFSYEFYEFDSADSVYGGSGIDTVSLDYSVDLRDAFFQSIEKLALDGSKRLNVQLTSRQVSDDPAFRELDKNLKVEGTSDTVEKIIIDPDEPGNIDLSGWSFTDVPQSLITVQASPATSNIIGSSLNDTLNGGADEDTLRGGDGDDTLNGGANQDTLHGGDGNDTVRGGDGIDKLNGGAGQDDLLDLSGQSFSGWEINLEDEIAFQANNRFQPSSLLHETIANFENVKGSTGNNTIRGSKGNNRLDANEGADVLQPNQGADELLGGDGSDEFVFEPQAGPNNIIKDFEDNVDTLNLSAFDFTDFDEVENIATEVSEGLELELATREVTTKIPREEPVPHVETHTDIERDKVMLMGMDKEDFDTSDVSLTADQGLSNTIPDPIPDPSLDLPI